MHTISEFRTTTDLLKSLSERLGPNDILADDLLIISQSRPLIDLINYKLAQARGVFIKPRIELGESSFRLLLESITIDGQAISGVDKIVFPDSLSLWIWDFLTKPEQANLVESLGLSGANALRIFEYSTSLAKAYHQYTLNNDEPEAWQSDEFDKRIVYEKVLSEAENKYATLGAMLGRTTKKLKKASKINLPFKRIIVVGSAFLPIKGIAFLRELKGVDLEYMVVNPLDLIHAPSYNIEPWARFGRKNFEALGDKALIGNSLRTSELKEIAIIACPSPQREVSYVKEKILAILGTEPQTPLNQIGIIAPDPALYEPYLKSMFADSDSAFDLGLHIVDEEVRPLSSLASLMRIFSLHNSNLRRSEILELLSFGPIQKTFGLNPAFFDSLKDWIIASGIFEHIDSSSRDIEGILSGDRGTWTSLLKKIGSLLLRGPDDLVSIKSLGSSHFEAIEGFMKFLVAISDFQKETKVNRYIKDWATFTRELFDPEHSRAFVTWSDDDDEEHQRVLLGNVISNTVNLTHDMKGFDTKIDFEFYLSLLREQLGSQYVQKGQALLHGVTIGRFSPARLIPFRHLFVIGLDDKAFPAPETNKRLETINGRPIKESRDQDLYCLVEIFASVSHTIHFTYQARDPKSREWTPPSSVLWSLKDWLKDSIQSYELTLTADDPSGHKSDTLPDTKFIVPPRISPKKATVRGTKVTKPASLKEFVDLDKFKDYFKTPFSTFYDLTAQFKSFYQSDDSIDDDPDFDLKTSARKQLGMAALETALRLGPDQSFEAVKVHFDKHYESISEARDLMPNFSLGLRKSADLLELDSTLELIGRVIGGGQGVFDQSQVIESDFFSIPTHEAIEVDQDLPKIVANQRSWQYENKIIVIDSTYQYLKSYAGFMAIMAAVAHERKKLTRFAEIGELVFLCAGYDKSCLSFSVPPSRHETDEISQGFLTLYRGIFDAPSPLFSGLIEHFVIKKKGTSDIAEGIDAGEIGDYIDDLEPSDFDFSDPYNDIFFKLFMNFDRGDETWKIEAKKSLDAIGQLYSLCNIREVELGQN